MIRVAEYLDTTAVTDPKKDQPLMGTHVNRDGEGKQYCVTMVRLAAHRVWFAGCKWQNQVHHEDGKVVRLTEMNSPRACMLQFSDIVAALSAKQ